MPADFGEVASLAVDLGKSGPRVGKAAADVVRKTAAQVKATAEQNTPVRTGRLQSRYTVDVTGDGRSGGVTATVANTVPYAEYVEFGTSRMPPEPSLGPSLERHAPGFEKALEVAAEGETL